MPHKLKLGFISGFSIAALFALSSFIITKHASISNVILKAIGIGIIGGTITPLSFQKWWKKSPRFFSKNHFKCEPGESIIHQSDAIHFINQKKCKGVLFLTEKRLVFLPKNETDLQKQHSINLAQIQNTSTFNPLGMMTEGLEIYDKNGGDYRFVVDKADLWASIIGKTLNR